MVTEKFTVGITPDAKLIREEVFMQEQGYKHEFDELDNSLWTLVLYLDGTPISTGRLEEIDPETYQIERIAVRKQFRGMNVGSYTVKYLCNKAISLGARKCILHAQADKVHFYETLGFKIRDGEIDFDEGNPHVWMYKVIVKSKRKFRVNY